MQEINGLTEVEFLKAYDQYKQGDKVFGDDIEPSLINALIAEEKIKVIAAPKKKEAPKKQEDKKEVKSNDDSIKNSADSGTDNADRGKKSS